MTRYEMLKQSSLNDIASSFCYFFSEIAPKGCNSCPVEDKCYVGHNGMKEFLLEEVEDGVHI